MSKASMEFEFLENKKAEKTSNSGKQIWRIKEKGEITEEAHIPQEIIDNILGRLPLKSLVRFESVCKAWRSSLSNPNFRRRDRHSILSTGKSSDAQIYYVIREQEKPFVVSFPVFWDERSEKSRNNREDQNSRVHVSNSCNGMVLVCVGTSFYLINPSVRYSVKVLTLDYLDEESGFDGHRHYKLHIGLYYDETISDYKAVVLICHEFPQFSPFSPFINSETIVPQLSPFKRHATILVEASLRGKRWNYLNHTFKYYDRITVGPMVNGHIHWLKDKKIIRYNPVLKVFRELPSFQPPPNHSKDCNIAGIGILEGCLCVSRIFNKNNLEILAMKEYGASDSWAPIFSFPVGNFHYIYDCSDCSPLLLTRAGELLISMNDRIRMRDLSKKSFKDFPWPNTGLSYSVSFVQNMDMPQGYYWNQTEHGSLGKTEDFKRLDMFRKEIAEMRSKIGEWRPRLPS